MEVKRYNKRAMNLYVVQIIKCVIIVQLDMIISQISNKSIKFLSGPTKIVTYLSEQKYVAISYKETL